MAKVVLDANVIVSLRDVYDSRSGRATKVLDGIHSAGDSQLLLDSVVAEAISVICHRASERKKNILVLPAVLDQVNRWYQRNLIAKCAVNEVHEFRSPNAIISGIALG